MKRPFDFYVLLIVVLLCSSACTRGNSEVIDTGGDDSTQNLAAAIPGIYAQGNKLYTTDGKEFRAWGFNYGIYGGTLAIEQYWDDNWEAIESDFDEMKGYGANCIRLLVQYWPFMNDVNTPNQHALNQLKRLFRLAERKGIYVLLCGNNAFVKEHQPQWYTSLSDSARWMTQAVYWEAIAKAVGGSNALIGYDLMNEPVVAVSGQNGWTPGNPFGEMYFVQNIVRYNPNNYPISVVFAYWHGVLGNAIRKHDKKHFITIGFLGMQGFGSISKGLDLGSAHVYPKSGNIGAASDLLMSYVGERPLIISETSPLSCTKDELQSFILSHNKDVSGWIWHYHGKTVEELRALGTMTGAIQASNLTKFIEMAPTQK